MCNTQCQYPSVCGSINLQHISFEHFPHAAIEWSNIRKRRSNQRLSAVCCTAACSHQTPTGSAQRPTSAVHRHATQHISSTFPVPHTDTHTTMHTSSSCTRAYTSTASFHPSGLSTQTPMTRSCIFAHNSAPLHRLRDQSKGSGALRSPLPQVSGSRRHSQPRRQALGGGQLRRQVGRGAQ